MVVLVNTSALTVFLADNFFENLIFFLSYGLPTQVQKNVLTILNTISVSP